MAEATHVGFADESHWNDGRFRSIGLVTTPTEFVQQFNRDLQSIIANSIDSEFKWSKLGGEKYLKIAKQMCDFAIDHAVAGSLRVDVLIWDINDSRHAIQNRDDVENLGRMYYHLFLNVLRNRWGMDHNPTFWTLHPDEQSQMRWDRVLEFLDAASIQRGMKQDDSTVARNLSFWDLWYYNFNIIAINPIRSESSSLLQLADLFAGMAVFSHLHFAAFQKWAELPDDDGLTNSQAARFRLLRDFDSQCKQNKLGVSLRTKRGLKTFDPSNPINFWLYVPQSEEDKAPKRRS